MKFRNKKNGHTYHFEGLTVHSETLETMVCYRKDLSDLLWVRPAILFFEKFEPVLT